jgi:hypothetical protein
MKVTRGRFHKNWVQVVKLREHPNIGENVERAVQMLDAKLECANRTVAEHKFKCWVQITLQHRPQCENHISHTKIQTNALWVCTQQYGLS